MGLECTYATHHADPREPVSYARDVIGGAVLLRVATGVVRLVGRDECDFQRDSEGDEYGDFCEERQFHVRGAERGGDEVFVMNSCLVPPTP